ncbi:MAG: radical SAM protein [Desulfobacterales bacterium]|nr:radical SAM protein [Desulfobacterales bacterium]
MTKVKNILLINPPIRIHDKPRHIPHGIAIIANILRKKISNIDLCFLDWNANRYSEEKVSSIIAEKNWDIVLTGGLIPVYGRVIRIAEMVKSFHPKAKIIAGGSAAMSVSSLLLSNSKVDIVCTGEGEITSVELIQSLIEDPYADLSKISGIAYKDKNDEIIYTDQRPLIKDLDKESDLPAYDLLPMNIYLKNQIIGFGRDVDFISSRGCPFHCTFCYQPWGRKFRGHSVDFICEAILKLKKEYGVQFISFQDDEFMADRNRVYEFCERRNQLFPDIRWSCTGRVNLISEEIIKNMRSSGCCSISYGFESGSPRMLKAMQKAVTIEQMEKAVALNRQYGLPIPVSFILGMPGENQESCRETVDFCIKNNLHLESLMFATPYPGTQLFEYAVESGRIKLNDLHEFVIKLGDARDFLINLTDSFTDKELQEKSISMKKEVRAHYKPLSVHEIEQKIKDLYGELAEEYCKLSIEDKEHRAKHGAIDLF